MNETPSPIDPLDLDDEEWFSLPYEVQDIYYQPLIREFCTHLQNWRHCRLPRCRRGKICTGTKEMNKRDGRFPPCICDNDQHARLMAAVRIVATAAESAQG
ncbi:hypothetical protein [Rhizobium sp. LjRoot254]|uniref:hypothetical protein n=1 Tax=Rhizobium sp. LjRoot254 TaxID=3342297 RepID=UPI003ECF8235